MLILVSFHPFRPVPQSPSGNGKPFGHSYTSGKHHHNQRHHYHHSQSHHHHQHSHLQNASQTVSALSLTSPATTITKPQVQILSPSQLDVPSSTEPSSHLACGVSMAPGSEAQTPTTESAPPPPPTPASTIAVGAGDSRSNTTAAALAYLATVPELSQAVATAVVKKTHQRSRSDATGRLTNMQIAFIFSSLK